MITDLIKKGAGFVARPSHSRTLGLVLMLVLVAAVSLTVYVAQQQQETRQRASNENLFTNATTFDVTTETCDGFSYTGDRDTSLDICCPTSNPFYCSKNNQCGTTKDACDNFSAAAQPTPTPTPGPEVAVDKPVTPTPNACAVLPDCGSGLTCFASSSCSGACSPDQHKCLSGKDFNMAKSYNRKSVVCCNVPTPTPTAKKTVGQSCIQTAECETGLTCEYYEELGYSQCTPPTPTLTRPQCPAPQLSITNITETSILTRILNSNDKFNYRFTITKPDGSVVTTYYMSGASGDSGGTVRDALTPGTNYTVFANVFESDIPAECQAPGLSSTESITTLSTNPLPTPTPTCLSYKNQPTCVSDTNCAWEFINSQCHQRFCIDYQDSASCLGDSRCGWNVIQSKCFDRSSIPTPTPLSTSSTCINIADVNSLARLYIQGGSTVTLQMVNIKARQYLQNPCL